MATKSLQGFKGIPVPIGSLSYYSGNASIPYSYVLANGSALSRTDYPELFSAFGTSYGAPSPTTFSLPNLLTFPYLEGSSVFNPTPNPVSLPTSGAITLIQPNMPSLTQGNFTFQSWSLSASINGNSWYHNSGPRADVVELTANSAVKANSSDVDSYSGSASCNFGFQGPNDPFTPTLSSASTLDPAFITLVPIIKAFSHFIPVDTPDVAVGNGPFVVTPASQAYYPPAPEIQYSADTNLSGFLPVFPPYWT